MMLMQPGELHANADRTDPGDFIVVEVGEPLMKMVARDLGWPQRDLNLKLDHAATANPAMRRALERFRGGLCATLHDSHSDSARCTCRQSIDQHLENLTGIVAVYVQACAENSKELSFLRGRSAPVRKAIEYLHDHFNQPYSLADLARASGCGQFYLAHLFKEQVGVSPSVFKNRILVAKTCQALVASPLKPLEMIAWEVGWAGRLTGFEDAGKASLMIRHFQRTLKLTPGEFRSSLRRMSPSERRDYVAKVKTVRTRPMVSGSDRKA